MLLGGVIAGLVGEGKGLAGGWGGGNRGGTAVEIRGSVIDGSGSGAVVGLRNGDGPGGGAAAGRGEHARHISHASGIPRGEI